MTLKHIALLGPLFIVSSAPATCGCDEALAPAPPERFCTTPADTVGCADTLGGANPWQLYWGDLHGHTAFSDGAGTVDHYFTYARDTSRLDFAVVTDHDYGDGTANELPREVWALTNDKVDAYTVDGRFIAIAGYEWTTNPIFWTGKPPRFAEPVKYYDHKNVYFPGRVDYIFGAMEAAYRSPDLLAEAVRKAGGLIHNDHPDPPQWPDEFDYTAASAEVIVNTEMWPDTVQVATRRFTAGTEQTLRAYLGAGGKTGFVGGSDTHEGTPAIETAVLASALTRPAIFDALRHRRNYAVYNARIVLDVRINGHFMGEEIAIRGAPRIAVDVGGTDTIDEVAIIRDGTVIHTEHPGVRQAKFSFVDAGFAGRSWYYVRVIQADVDRYGNRSRAWSSPIWVTAAP
jgi:hypothetical protein